MTKIKCNLTNWIINLLCLYFIMLFFYGVIIKITFNNSILFQIKTFLPEIILFLICILAFLKRRKYKALGVITVLYFMIVLFLNIFTSYSTPSFLMTFRDVYIPIITALFLSNIKMTKDEYKKFLDKMLIISFAAIICGFLLGIMQYIKGYEWASAWYTGYSFWGVDEKSSILIRTSGNHVRVPSIIGNNAKFAMYSLLQILFVFRRYHEMNVTKNKKMILILIMILGVINIIISNNKTTIVILLFILFIHVLRKFNKKSKIIIAYITCLVVLGLCFYLSVFTDFLLSFWDRFLQWSIIFELDLTYNLIIPVNLFNFAGNSVTINSVLNYWDNTYLYIAFGYGILGLLLLLIWIVKLYNDSLINNDNTGIVFVNYLTLFTLILAFTTSIVLGRAFFNVFIILIALESAKEKG